MSELEKMFARRASNIDESASANAGANASASAGSKPFNPSTEFPEFSRKQLKVYKELFNKYDLNKSGTINNEELKKMMEKLGKLDIISKLKSQKHFESLDIMSLK